MRMTRPSLSLIKKAEEELGVIFPVSYKQFVLDWPEFDGFAVEFFEFVDCGCGPTIVSATVEARRRHGLPKELIPFAREDQYWFTFNLLSPGPEYEVAVHSRMIWSGPESWSGFQEWRDDYLMAGGIEDYLDDWGN